MVTFWTYAGESGTTLIESVTHFMPLEASLLVFCFLHLLSGPQREKNCFRVPDKLRFKPASLATESSLKIEILVVASLDMMLSRMVKKSALTCNLYKNKKPVIITFTYCKY